MKLGSGFCPFHKHAEAPPPQPVAPAATPEIRMQRLREFVGADSFICTIGTKLEQAGVINYTPLTDPGAEGNFLSQLKAGLETFIARPSGAWIMLFPSEPQTYRELRETSHRVHGDLITTAMMRGIWDKEERIIQSSRRSQRIEGAAAGIPETEQLMGIDRETFLGLFAPVIREKSALPGFSFEAEIVKFGVELSKAMPNALPVIDKVLPLQLVVMSPLFEQGQTPQCPVTQQYRIAHGRYAPATCLVVTSLAEVNRSKGTEAGVVTGENLRAATLVYNEYASEGGKYHPSSVLTGPFQFKPGAAPDEFLMQNVKRILEANAPLLELQQIFETLSTMLGGHVSPEQLAAMDKGKLKKILEMLNSKGPSGEATGSPRA